MSGAEKNLLSHLLAGLTRQRDLYLRLQAEAADLHAEAEREPESADVAAILAAAEARQKSLEELEEIEAALAPLRAEWSTQRQHYSEQQRRPLADLVDELGRLMQAVAKLEEENSHLVQRHSRALARELERARHARRASQAYGEKPAAQPRFYDHKQ